MSDKTTVTGRWTEIKKDGASIEIVAATGTELWCKTFLGLTVEQAEELADLLFVALGRRTVVVPECDTPGCLFESPRCERHRAAGGDKKGTAMSGVNKVILIGHLGADPELRYTSNGTSVCELRMATSESWKDKDGGRQERTEWHRIVAWGKLGEVCGKYLRKGSQAYVEGRIETRSWDDKDGNKRYTTQIVASEVQFLSGGKGSSQPRQESDHDAQDHDDDLPF